LTVTALNAQWQEQRRQRQQELAERQQKVREALASFQNERYAQASQMRDDLTLYRVELQQGTQVFLQSSSQQRQQQAEQMAQFLRNFAWNLQVHTSEFLKLTTAERSLMAQQLSQDLGNFHQHLHQSVAALRSALQARMQELQAEVEALQAATQQSLQTSRDERLRHTMQQAQELAAFAETLRTNVQAYLTDLDLVHQERTQQLQALLQTDRAQRQVTMDAIFQNLADFRADLRQYCADLRSMVWGDAVPVAPPVAKPQPRVAPVAPKPQPAAPPKAAAPTPIAATPEPVPSVAPSVEDPAQPSLADRSRMSEPETINVNAPDRAMMSAQESMVLEKDIYNYIHDGSGARLTDIETALGINRFQAVDALRALIKKGWVTQRDRTYLIQEEVKL
jgi:hypothetical protein